ncbi:Hypothetical predicted protein, partial [Paramuricea clavata]
MVGIRFKQTHLRCTMKVSLHLRCRPSSHNIYILLGISLLYIIANGSTQSSDDTTKETSCQSKDDSQFNINLNLQRQTRDVVMMKHLPRIDPVKVDYTRNVQIVPGKTHQMRTLALNPPIF